MGGYTNLVSDPIICSNVVCVKGPSENGEYYRYEGDQIPGILWKHTFMLRRDMSKEEIDEYLNTKIKSFALVVADALESISRNGWVRTVFTVLHSRDLMLDDPKMLVDGTLSSLVVRIAGIATDEFGNIEYLFVNKHDYENACEMKINAIGIAKFLRGGSYDVESGILSEFYIEHLQHVKLVRLDTDQYLRMRALFTTGCLPSKSTNTSRRRDKSSKITTPHSCAIL